MMSPPPPPAYDPHRMEANGGHQGKSVETSSSFLLCMNVINLLTHFFLGAITFSAFSYVITVTYFTSLNRYWLNFHEHVYLCMIGYGILMCNAILEFNPYVGWGIYLQQRQKTMIGIIMQICGSGLAITGSMMKYFDWTWSLNSTHSYLGFIAMILTFFSFFGGIVNFIVTQQGRSKSSAFDLGYACVTALTMTVAFLAIIFAFNDAPYRQAFNHPAASLSVSLTVFTMTGLLILIFAKYVKK